MANYVKTCNTLRHSYNNISIKCLDIKFSTSSVKFNEDGDRLRNITTIESFDVDGRRMTIDRNGFKESISDGRIPSQCSEPGCRSCVLAQTFKEADALIGRLQDRQSKAFRSLIFRGEFAQPSRAPTTHYGPHEHHFINTHGLATLAPHVFEFNMPWRFWDIAILNEIRTTNLVALKVPLGIPSDCFELGYVLRKMTSLRSLTITDMPARSTFVSLFPFLGLGILSTAKTLRELDLTMTNYNRPDHGTWQDGPTPDEIFLKPGEAGMYFNKLFLELPENTEYHQYYLSMQKTIDGLLGLSSKDVNEHTTDRYRLLSLEKLRLENFDLLESAFERIFDGKRLKELRLPFCSVGSGVWQTNGSTQMRVIEEIDYQLLAEPLMEFLSQQPDLTSLGFARPPHEYGADCLYQWPGDEEPRLMIYAKNLASPLGPGTAWGKACCYGENMASVEGPKYPSLEQLLALPNMENLERLYLPACMYDLTEDAIRIMGCRLRGLKSLTCGFMYSDPRCQTAFAESFVLKPTSLRQLTLLSFRIPQAWHESERHETAFSAIVFDKFLLSLGERISSQIRHVRYNDFSGQYGEGVVVYHRQAPKDGNCWKLLRLDKGIRMFDQDLTPQILPEEEN